MNIIKATARLLSKTFTPARGFLPMTLLTAVVISPVAEAATDTPPNRMTVQSYITDDTGTPLGSTTSVNKKMVFVVYNADTGGDVVFADEQIVTVDAGHFSVVLGEGSPVGDESHDLATAFSGDDASDRFIEIQVSDTDGSNAQTLSPRLRLLPSAYAFLAAYANEAARVTGGGVDTAAISDSAVNSAKVANESLTVSDLGPNSVGSSEVINNSLTAADLAANSVGNSELATNITHTGNLAVNQWWPNVTLGLKSVNSSDYMIYGINSAGTNNFYINSAGTLYARGGLASNMVNSATVSDNTLTANDLATNSVGAAEIAANAVAASEIAANAVGNSEIASNVQLAGRVGVNGRYSNCALVAKQYVSGDLLIMAGVNSAGTQVWYLDKSGNSGKISDGNLKQDIAPIENSLEKAMQLRPVNYRFKTEPEGALQVGFIAQEVQEVIPSAVTELGENFGLSYDTFGVLAIGAIQELNAKVEALESENASRDRMVEALRYENAALSERLTALEALVQSLAE